MKIQELEQMFRETGEEILTFKMIDHFRLMQGKSVLSSQEKLNLCAQEKYSSNIQRVYLSCAYGWISGFEISKEDF